MKYKLYIIYTQLTKDVILDGSSLGKRSKNLRVFEENTDNQMQPGQKKGRRNKVNDERVIKGQKGEERERMRRKEIMKPLHVVHS